MCKALADCIHVPLHAMLWLHSEYYSRKVRLCGDAFTANVACRRLNAGCFVTDLGIICIMLLVLISIGLWMIDVEQVIILRHFEASSPSGSNYAESPGEFVLSPFHCFGELIHLISLLCIVSKHSPDKLRGRTISDQRLRSNYRSNGGLGLFIGLSPGRLLQLVHGSLGDALINLA